MNTDISLLQRLEQYSKMDYYPFHMPGHKRNLNTEHIPSEIDITEIEGFDNLHHAQDVLFCAQKRAAKLYGAEESFFLVNGSTCGILAAISAAVPYDGRMLFARNSHKSAYHGIFLRNACVFYLYPQVFEEYRICGGISADEVERVFDEACRNGERLDAVYLTSPTYEGMVSNIGEIADIIHRKDCLLIVDEAHGAHFGFGEDYFPRSAVAFGADIVIQSLHKTLPCLTQTAILHVQGDRVDRGKLRKYLQIYQSSSPSYVLMSSIDYGIRLIEEQGKNLFKNFSDRLRRFYKKAENLHNLYVLQPQEMSGICAVSQMDPSKICIFTNRTAWSGMDLYERLLERYHLQMEMAAGDYVIAMTSVMDTEEGFERLMTALEELDGESCKAEGGNDAVVQGIGKKKAYHKIDVRSVVLSDNSVCHASIVMSAGEAEMHSQEVIGWEDSLGRISGEYRYVYPPGIPFLVPGERITREVLQRYKADDDFRLRIEGEEYGKGRISVVME